MRQRLTDGTEDALFHPEVGSMDGKTVLRTGGRTPNPANASTTAEAIANTCHYDGTIVTARHDFLPTVMITMSGSQGKKIATKGIGD